MNVSPRRLSFYAFLCFFLWGTAMLVRVMYGIHVKDVTVWITTVLVSFTTAFGTGVTATLWYQQWKKRNEN